MNATVSFPLPAGFSFTSRANAVSITATPAFTSHDPRPYSRPPSTVAPNGSTIMPSMGTVSVCASNSTLNGAGCGGV